MSGAMTSEMKDVGGAERMGGHGLEEGVTSQCSIMFYRPFGGIDGSQVGEVICHH